MKNPAEAFTFVFSDPNWVSKVLIGGLFVLLSFCLIGVPVLYGYCIELQQRVRRGEQYPLPEWKDVGVKFILGFKYIVTLMIYYLPLVIVAVPLVLFSVIATVSGSEMGHAFGGATVMILLLFFIMPFSLLLTVLTPVISIRFAERERIGDGVDLGEVFRMFREHWQESIVAILLGIVAGILAMFGLLLFLVGVLFTSFYALLVRHHLFGQIARQEAVGA
jgi:hypothetical protein